MPDSTTESSEQGTLADRPLRRYFRHFTTTPKGGCYGMSRLRWSLGHMTVHGLCAIADGIVSLATLGFVNSDFTLTHAFRGAQRGARRARVDPGIDGRDTTKTHAGSQPEGGE